MDKENSNWPDWLLERYGALQLPSLYDFILANEKCAVELRKQNRELKCHNERMETVISRLDDIAGTLEIMQEREEDDNENEEAVQSDQYEIDPDEENEMPGRNNAPAAAEVLLAQQVLIQSMDSLFHLLNGLKSGNEKILKKMPHKKSFWSSQKPAWRLDVEDILEGQSDGIKTVKQKLMAAMADVGVNLINPAVGELFDPMECRAVETSKGNPKGTIAQIIRYGYKINDKITRFADVVIFN